ncbi:MAG: hypothetical protein R3C27_16350 [Hyphomonadaceae bacterium]
MFEGDADQPHHRRKRVPSTRTAQSSASVQPRAEVRTAYQNVIEEGAHYNPPPAHNLLLWISQTKSGLLFEVNEQGIVTSVHAGGPSIRYMKGCA